MNEWGLPDWLDSSTYGDTARWDMDRWRWEFYRRRKDLRAFFDLWASDPRNQKLSSNQGLNPFDPGFRALSGPEGPSSVHLFGYFGLPNPRIGDQPKHVIIPSESFLRPLRVYDPAKRPPHTHSPPLGVIRRYEYGLKLQFHEIAIRFDVNRPLVEQIDYARDVLRRKQTDIHGKLIQRRPHPKKWLSYLRALDAREADVPWARITEVFHCEDILGRYKDPAGGYRPPDDAASRFVWKQARNLCFNF